MNTVLAKMMPYKGKMPIKENVVIKVKTVSTTTKCSHVCHHAKRLTSIRAGKRIFLTKIKIEYTVLDNVVSLNIRQ